MMTSIEKIFKGKGLFCNFIRQKLDNYVEPERVGVPRQESKGFSKKKYTALLMTMSALKKKVIAKELDMSYGLLRNWNLEKDFDSLRQRYCREFADLLYHKVTKKVTGYVREIHALDVTPTPQQISDYEAYFKEWKSANPDLNELKYIEMLAQTNPLSYPTLSFPFLDDCESYGECIIDELWTVLITHQNTLEENLRSANYDDAELLAIIFDVITQIILFPSDLKSLSVTYGRDEHLFITIKDNLEKKANRLLSRNVLSARDRKSLMFMMTILRA